MQWQAVESVPRDGSEYFFLHPRYVNTPSLHIARFGDDGWHCRDGWGAERTVSDRWLFDTEYGSSEPAALWAPVSAIPARGEPARDGWDVSETAPRDGEWCLHLRWRTVIGVGRPSIEKPEISWIRRHWLGEKPEDNSGGFWQSPFGSRGDAEINRGFWTRSALPLAPPNFPASAQAQGDSNG